MPKPSSQLSGQRLVQPTSQPSWAKPGWLADAPPRYRLGEQDHRRGAGRLWLRPVVSLAMLLAVPLLPARTHAQDAEATTQELRLRQLEAEMRALQHQPPASGGVATGNGSAGNGATPAVTPMTNLLTRMDALEAAVARLTAQYEELDNHLRETNARLTALTPPPTPTPTPLLATTTPAAPAATPPSPRSRAQRLAAIKAVARPHTGDAAEDAYTYGFNLWQAHFYPEAEQQLQIFLNTYPHHPRASYARNLIGRAHLDDGDQKEAAKWFLTNYETDREGARAPDSMLYLARTMIEIKDTNRACIALAEFANRYAKEASGRLHDTYEQTRASVTCPN